MTKWQEFPLRPQARPWAGINTRSGKLDDGSGQMTDSSVNCIINEADKLEKRKGMIRGLDERFAGAVCGLHKYTDECGREWLLVADEGGFSIRQPFAIPSFTSSDAYPSDSFQAAGTVNVSTWQNTALYEQAGGLLVLKSGETNGGDLVWFKEATNFSYESTFEYFVDGACSLVGIIKRSSGQARIEARVSSDGVNISGELVWIDSTGAESSLGTLDLGTTVFTGTVVLSYQRNTVTDQYVVTMDATPTDSGLERVQDFTTLTALDDADLGQGTALRVERTLTTTTPGIESVQGDPL